jgi:hypothetical protein
VRVQDPCHHADARHFPRPVSEAVQEKQYQGKQFTVPPPAVLPDGGSSLGVETIIARILLSLLAIFDALERVRYRYLAE